MNGSDIMTDDTSKSNNLLYEGNSALCVDLDEDKPSETGTTAVPGSALSREELDQLTEKMIEAIKTVYDPEIPVDVYELGLIYKIDVDDNRNIDVDMTLTAPGCPVAGEMPIWVENAIASIDGVGNVKVTLVFDPPWDMSRLSDEARVALNMF